MPENPLPNRCSKFLFSVISRPHTRATQLRYIEMRATSRTAPKASSTAPKPSPAAQPNPVAPAPEASSQAPKKPASETRFKTKSATHTAPKEQPKPSSIKPTPAPPTPSNPPQELVPQSANASQALAPPQPSRAPQLFAPRARPRPQSTMPAPWYRGLSWGRWRHGTAWNYNDKVREPRELKVFSGDNLIDFMLPSAFSRKQKIKRSAR